MKNGTAKQIVVVTGASGGVGRATAHAFAKRGASVGLLARGAEGLEAAAAEVESFGGTGFAVPTDVADPDQVEAAAKAVEERFGPIDVWVNDAMATIFAPFAEITAAEFTRATQVTYLGTVYGTMAALKRMVPTKPWHGRTGRLRTRLSRHPLTVGLLRRKVRDPGLHRLGAHRAAPQQEPRLDIDGAASGG